MSLITFPNSGKTYYFRSKIPADLVEHFDGVKEFRISLKCAIKSRSIRTTIQLELLRFLIEKSQEYMRKLDKI